MHGACRLWKIASTSELITKEISTIFSSIVESILPHPRTTTRGPVVCDSTSPMPHLGPAAVVLYSSPRRSPRHRRLGGGKRSCRDTYLRDFKCHPDDPFSPSAADARGPQVARRAVRGVNECDWLLCGHCGTVLGSFRSIRLRGTICILATGRHRPRVHEPVAPDRPATRHPSEAQYCE